MTNANARTRATVAVIGGGYGGTVAAKAIDEFADVTLVEPRDAFVHNVAALRALVEPEWLPRIFFPYDRLLANGRVVRDRAVGGRRRSGHARFGSRTHTRLHRARHRLDVPLSGQVGHGRDGHRARPLLARATTSWRGQSEC